MPLQVVHLPEHRYFSRDDVGALLKLPPQVLRIWEKEFERFFSPPKGKSSHRLFRRPDVRILMEIHQLLYLQRLTLAEAKAEMMRRYPDDPYQLLVTTYQELRTLRDLLRQEP
jgi:DNA-binding transcriptional MerR regulator